MMYEILDINNGTYWINHFADKEYKCTPKHLFLNEDEFEDFKIGKKEV